jgi:hypothetical protein
MHWKRIIFGLGLWVIFSLFDPNTVAAQGIEKKEQRYPNGNLLSKGKLKNGQMHGIWMYYYPQGKVLGKEKYTNGKLAWRIEYDSTGKKTRGINAIGDTIVYKTCNCKN